jgi:phage terminase large subunit
MIWQFRHPDPLEDIVIGADPAEGNDYCAWVALSKKHADVVMVGRNKTESSQLGHELNHVGRWFHRQTTLFPNIAPERNVGSATIYVLKELNYPNIYRAINSFTKTTTGAVDSFGWSTNTATRPKMLDDLALAIRQKVISIPSKHIVDEMFQFIRHEKTGKPQAEVGTHDDLVMALAIAWQLYQLVPAQETYSSQNNPRYNKEMNKFRIGK